VDIVKQVWDTIVQEGMLDAGHRVLVGVSGGPDSICLLHVLNERSAEWGIELNVVHVNHGLREEAAEEAAFVEQVCQGLRIPFFCRKIDAAALSAQTGVSVEMAGRRERYRIFAGLARELDVDRIAVGHTADDQVETVLMNLIRGAGITGLAGIPPVREDIIRPLIYTWRSEIEDYLRKKQLQYVIDKSNMELIYRRNRVRWQLLPVLERHFNPGVKEVVARTARLLRDDELYLNRMAHLHLEELQAGASRVGPNGAAGAPPARISLPVDRFRCLPLSMQRRVVRAALEQIQGDIAGIGFSHIAAVLSLVKNSQTGSSVSLPSGIRAHLDYDRLVFSKCSEGDPGDSDEVLIPVPGERSIDRFSCRVRTAVEDFADVFGSEPLAQHELNKRIREKKGSEGVNWISGERFRAFLDLEAVDGQLYLRSRREGDRISPLGLGGTRKVKDIFIDAKIPRRWRRLYPIVCDNLGPVWIVGLCIACRVAVRPDSRRILLVEIFQ